jgi:type II secretory pathway pseudopilin PulG
MRYQSMPYCANCGTQVAAISYAPCPNCGRATNGAVRPAGSAGGDQSTKAILIILGVAIGGLMLVAVIGIVAAIAVPNFLTAKQRAAQKRTMADIRSIASEVEAHRAAQGAYPQTLTDLKTPTVDGWRHPLKYECLSQEAACDGYAIASPGKDGVFEHDDLTEYSEEQTEDFDCDIVLANGVFVQYPQGAQR